MTTTCPPATAAPSPLVPLSADERAAFARDGYVIARGVLTAGDLSPVHAELSAAIDAKARTLHAAGQLADLHAQEPFDRRFGFLMAQNPAIQHGFDVNQLRGPALFRLLHTPRLLDAVEQLIGGEITCNPIQHVRAKPPQHQTADTNKGYFSVPWHQDSGVNVAEADTSDILTTWVALVDVDENMGPVQVLPGVHCGGHLEHDQGDGYGTAIKAALLPRVAPVKCIMKAGDVLIMHRHCPHHSTPNRSDRCRWSLDLRYHVTGHNSGRPWQPEFVVRSRSATHPVMTDHATWDRMWRDCLAQLGGGRVMHRLGTAS